jgi:hypothetical protein
VQSVATAYADRNAVLSRVGQGDRDRREATRCMLCIVGLQQGASGVECAGVAVKLMPGRFMRDKIT